MPIFSKRLNRTLFPEPLLVLRCNAQVDVSTRMEGCASVSAMTEAGGEGIYCEENGVVLDMIVLDETSRGECGVVCGERGQHVVIRTAKPC